LNPAFHGKLSTYVERHFAWKVANLRETSFHVEKCMRGCNIFRSPYGETPLSKN